MRTKAFLKSRDERKRVEMRFAHLKVHHGFERMRLRGLSGARDEFHLAAIVQNLKTLALREFKTSGPATFHSVRFGTAARRIGRSKSHKASPYAHVSSREEALRERRLLRQHRSVADICLLPGCPLLSQQRPTGGQSEID